MAENEIAMGQNRHCLETMFQCLEDYVTGYTDKLDYTAPTRNLLFIGPFFLTFSKCLNMDRG